jgi:GTP-binding protein
MFLDEARILIAAGRGGDGMVHFRHEKFVPRGGPDGGNGGRGGDVILQVETTLNTLDAFRHTSRYHAQDGAPGGRNDRTGRSGDDIVIRVPPGTIVREDATRETLGDLVAHGQTLVVGKGGRGGRGNARFANSRNQAPRMAERGEPGEERWLALELRLIADVGIVGVPNAGKSTLLAAVSEARPKIGAYPFTTLSPNLGVAHLDAETALILADIPGLIEGAHNGAGLGMQFLRHIQRTRALIHLIDGASTDPLADFSQVNAELALFDPGLADKPQVVAVNKIDLPDVAARWPEIEASFRRKGFSPIAVSALTRRGVRDLLGAAWQARQEAPEPVVETEMPVYRPQAPDEEFAVHREADGGWRLEGRGIERAAAMTYWEYEEGVRRFQRLMERLGIEDALRRAGAADGDTIRVGDHELEWQG